jgi:hypothetical protein
MNEELMLNTVDIVNNDLISNDQLWVRGKLKYHY